MTDIFFSCLSIEGCFTCIIHHFAAIIRQISPYLPNVTTTIYNLPFLYHSCVDFNATKKNRSLVF